MDRLRDEFHALTHDYDLNQREERDNNDDGNLGRPVLGGTDINSTVKTPCENGGQSNLDKGCYPLFHTWPYRGDTLTNDDPIF